MVGTVNPYWQSYVDGFYFGHYPDQKYKRTSKLAIVDSGWTTLSGPKTEMEFIIKVVLEKLDQKKVVLDSNGRYWLSCATEREKLPTIYIRFGGYYLEVKNTDYATPNP